MQFQHLGLQALPVELLYELQLYALSPALPCLSHFFWDIFDGSPTSFRVQFLLASCTTNNSSPSHAADILSKALRYPLCTPTVLDQLCSRVDILSQIHSRFIIPHDSKPSSSRQRARTCEVPRRLFRSLVPSRKDDQAWRAEDEALRFLRHILNKGTSFPDLDPNSHQGYALTRAVHARHTSLVRLLLQLGASPACKEAIAVKVAIKQRNLKMVKLLVERNGGDGYMIPGMVVREAAGKPQKGKRRRLEDWVEVDQSMLRLAVKCNAEDIIDYLTCEKGVIPDMQTLTSVRG